MTATAIWVRLLVVTLVALSSPVSCLALRHAAPSPSCLSLTPVAVQGEKLERHVAGVFWPLQRCMDLLGIAAEPGMVAQVVALCCGGCGCAGAGGGGKDNSMTL